MDNKTSISVHISVPPKWAVEPRDINVSVGQSVSLQCMADPSTPPSTISWKRATPTTGEYKDVANPYRNGTIRFDNVRKGDEGAYLCEISNGVGSGLSKLIFIKVNGKPKFKI